MSGARYLKHYSVFFEKPDEVETRYCEICSAECDVERSILTYPSFACAMGKHKVLVDCFRCPHGTDEIHREYIDNYFSDHCKD